MISYHRNRVRAITLLAASTLAVCGLALTLNLLTRSPLALADVSAQNLHRTQDDPCGFTAITVTADLGATYHISDTLPGSVNDRIIYFANHEPGIITITAAVSNTAPISCHVWGGTAFGRTEAPHSEFLVGAESDRRWITYPLSITHGSATLILTSSLNITGSLLPPHHTTVLTFTQDITPPHDIHIVAPEHTAATVFPVSWSIWDEGSGIVSYTAEYSGTAYTAWQAWQTNTITTSGALAVGTFSATHTETSYIFRIITYDHVGHDTSARAETFVGPFRIYLPLVLHDYPPRWQAASGIDDVEVYDISVCPTAPNSQYAGTNQGLYHSTDGGDTWQRWALDGSTILAIVSTSDCNQVFAAVWGGGVNHVTGPAQSTPINQGLDDLYLYGLAISADEQTLYAGTNTNGIYKTNLTNINWSEINNGIPVEDRRIRSIYIINDTMYAGGRQCTYYRSDNAGDSWQARTVLAGGQSSPCDDAQVWAIAEMDNVIYVGLGKEKGLYQSANEGTSWTRISAIPTITIRPFGLRLYRSNLYVSTLGQGLYICKSETSCYPRPSAGLGTLNTRGFAIAEMPNVRLLAGSDDGIWWIPLLP